LCSTAGAWLKNEATLRAYSTQVGRALDDDFTADDPAVSVTAFCR
jgi:hypothetical protein